MHATTLLFPLAATALLAGFGLSLRHLAEVPAALPSSTPSEVAATTAPDAGVPAVGVVHAAAPKASAPAAIAETTFADGSKLPALNGVTMALTMPWPGGGPFSPVLEVITHQGQQWYRHEDGSMSTTVVARDEVSGKPVTVPMCCRPEPVMKALQRARR